MSTLADFQVPYPPPAPGQERKVIVLPPAHPELEQQHLRVQLIVGRHEDCEDGRLYHLTGTFASHDLEGWGYTYHVVTLGDIYAAHRSPADPENATTFVAMYEKPMVNYNSKLPIVVYVPEGAEVHYRVWSDEVARSGNVATTPPSAQPQGELNYADMEELDDGRHDGHHPHAAQHQGQEEQEAEEYPAEPQPVAEAVEVVEAAQQQQEDQQPVEEAHHHHEQQPQRGIPELPPQGAEEEEQPQQHHHRSHHHQQEQEYVGDSEAAPVLQASEKANEREHSHKKDDPASEKRRHSSSKQRKRSTEGSATRARGLSAVEESNGELGKASRTSNDRAGSATKRHSSSSGTATDAKDKNGDKEKEKEGTYEKKAKNFWNRARGNSKSKSPKKESSGDKWSEM